jgi:hypothetical protein
MSGARFSVCLLAGPVPVGTSAKWQPLFFLDKRAIALVRVVDCAKCGGVHEVPLIAVPLDDLERMLEEARKAADDTAAVDPLDLERAIAADLAASAPIAGEG